MTRRLLPMAITELLCCWNCWRITQQARLLTNYPRAFWRNVFRSRTLTVRIQSGLRLKLLGRARAAIPISDSHAGTYWTIFIRVRVRVRACVSGRRFRALILFTGIPGLFSVHSRAFQLHEYARWVGLLIKFGFKCTAILDHHSLHGTKIVLA